MTSDFPQTPDAQNVSSSQGNFTYSSSMSAKQVADFYRQTLPPLGFSIEEQGSLGDETTYMWSVTRGSDRYILNIMQSNGMTLVTVALLK